MALMHCSLVGGGASNPPHPTLASLARTHTWFIIADAERWGKKEQM